MSYHAEIIKATRYIEDNQPLLPTITESADSVAELVSLPTSIYTALHDQPDSALVKFVPADEVYPSEVIAKEPTRAELGALVCAYFDIMGIRPDEAMIDAFYGHESQHLKIARHLGAVGSKMGISLHLIPKVGGSEPVHSMHPFIEIGQLETTKLGVALITSYPEELSDGDKCDLAAMGYEDVSDVAQRLIRLPGEPYPLPLALKH